MNIRGLRLHVVLLLTVVVWSLNFYSAEKSPQQRCGGSGERCIPIELCPLYFNRIKAKEHLTNDNFMEQLRRLICSPEAKVDRKVYICCPTNNIQCEWNDNPAACTTRERCLALNGKSEPGRMLPKHTTLCYMHNDQIYVCCPDEKLYERSMSVRTSGKHQSPSAFRGCSRDGQSFLVPKELCDHEYTFHPDSTKVCCRLPGLDGLISHSKAAVLDTMPCGEPGLLVGFRIHNGVLAERGEFPWMVNLLYESGTRVACAGTLIHTEYVLTVAHCVRQIQNQLVKVRLGEYNVSKTAQPNTQGRPCDDDSCPPKWQEISIDKKIIHPTGDVALLRLRHPAHLVPGVVQPICLPIFKNLLMYLPSDLTIVGWGNTEQHASRHMRKTFGQPRDLLKANVRVLQDSVDCRQDFEICAGGPGHSNTCVGDSGGPYQSKEFYNGSMRYVQYGIITSGSASCISPDRPSKGMLVGYFLSWILDAISDD